ncbi:sensor domain-containing diguanylate cyclase [Mangrovitalea sediminis]|uniref:sensor domain-containing diguanylate cyclase n=1 Tax=Mangrovitalea sediminis TaxID=1982043 RepID=UPI000BE5A5A7|nr:sensor domain-containing diguanylate cyclase [Mangrovitalea sediminis]
MLIEKEGVHGVMEALPDAALVVDAEQRIILVNTPLCKLFGYDADQLRDAHLDRLIPEALRFDHAQHVEGYFAGPKVRPMGSGLYFFGRRADGSVFPVDIILNGMELDGRSMVMAVVRDNSDRVAVEFLKRDLLRANARLQQALNLGRMGWWEARLNEGVLLWSDAMRTLLQLPDDVKPSFDFIRDRCHPEDRDRVIADFDVLRQVKRHRAEFRIRGAAGESIWVEEVVEFSDREPDQKIALGVIRDITDQKLLEQRLRHESVTDELTTFFNRKRFDQELGQRFAEYQRTGTPFSLIIYDFDFFKSLNDRYGHAAGDLILRESSALIKEQLRVSDSVFRIGGEEFAIILPATEKAEATMTAERLRLAIADHAFNLDGQVLQVTITAGVGEVEPSDHSGERLQRRTDAALYQGKQLSRNLVCY